MAPSGLRAKIIAERAAWVESHPEYILKTRGADGIMTCPESGHRYEEVDPGVVKNLDLDEDAPLPAHLMKSEIPYCVFKEPSA